MKNRLFAALFWLFPFFVLAEPTRVQTGVYLMNVYDLNMAERSFYADFYIWLRWRGAVDPTKIEFVNSVEKWGMTQTAFDGDTIQTLSTGERYKIMRVEGRFFHSFSLADFPLDRHALDIRIENPDFPLDSVVYVADSAKIRPTLNMTGWVSEGCGLFSEVHDYGSDFGQIDQKASKFSQIVFETRLARPVSYFLLKLMLPLLVVMIVSLGALFIFPTLIDARISLPIGGLLTAVFLQQSYSSALPDTGYMVLMDKIYLLSYALVAAIMARVILTANELAGEKSRAEPKIMRIERRLALVLLALFLGGTAIWAFVF